MTKPVSVDIKKSPKKDKKLRAIFKDKERRSRYRKRHKKDLDTKDFKRAGYLSYYILWGDSSNLETAIKDYKKRFGLK